MAATSPIGAFQASVWYYFRERTYPKITQMFKDGIRIAEERRADDRDQMTYEVVASGLAGAFQPGHCRDDVPRTSSGRFAQMVGRRPGTSQSCTEGKCKTRRACALETNGLATTLSQLTKPSAIPIPAAEDRTILRTFPEPAHGGAALSGQYPGPAGSPLMNAIATATPIAHKGRCRRCQSGGHDAARPVGEARSGALCLIISTMSDQRSQIQKPSFPLPINRRSSSTKDHVRIPAGNEKVLLRIPTKYATYLEQPRLRTPTVRGEAGQGNDEGECVVGTNEVKTV